MMLLKMRRMMNLLMKSLMTSVLLSRNTLIRKLIKMIKSSKLILVVSVERVARIINLVAISNSEKLGIAKRRR
jgi:hypothetical protein